MKLVVKIFFLLYLVYRINWIKFYKNYDSYCNNLIFINTAKWSLRKYVLSATLENDFALINTFLELNKPFRISFNHLSLLNIKRKNIFFNLSKYFDFIPSENYSSSLMHFQEELIKNDNNIVPDIENTQYWENKIYMHKMFNELGISHPNTIFVDDKNPAQKVPNLTFPFLFKPAHASGSTGIEKIDSLEQYHEIIEKTVHKEYLLQEWIDMKKDLRLIYIGDELVLHYWRINQGSEWTPTSTGHGSSVDFDSLPTDWMDFIFKEFKKLNLKAGALDITWSNDDLTTLPLILEVSPSFMPNPSPPKNYNGSYSEFKKSIFGKDAYYKKYIDLVFDLKLKLIREYDKK